MLLSFIYVFLILSASHRLSTISVSFRSFLNAVGTRAVLSVVSLLLMVQINFNSLVDGSKRNFRTKSLTLALLCY